jgi:alpha-glucosidase (family GH31 glycosyl hydrolase)
MLGDALLVAVIDQPDRHRRIKLPSGSWINYWDNAQVHAGPKTIELDLPDDAYPVFIRSGSIIPLNVTNDWAGHGTTASAGHTTLDVYPNRDRPAAFSLWDASGQVTALTAKLTGNRLTIGIRGGKQRTYVLRILADRRPRKIAVNASPLRSDTWRYDPADSRLWITTDSIRDANILIEFGQ